MPAMPPPALSQDRGRARCCLPSPRPVGTRFLRRDGHGDARTSGPFFVRMLQDARDRADHAFPLTRFGRQFPPACPGELVEARAPIAPRYPPLRLDEALP